MGSNDTRDRLAEIQAGTHAVIDLDRYASNLKTVAELAGPNRSVMAVVKANAYGHGAPACARAAVDAGCRYLGVARIDEALELRGSGITAPILVIGPPNMAEIGLAIENDIALTVATETSAAQVIDQAESRNRRAIVHVKIDTGLHRYGALPDLAVAIAGRIDSHPATMLEGLYTHFSSADEEELEPTVEQIERFQATYTRIRERGIDPQLVHIANSAATITGLFPDTNMVRAGIVSYGLDPSNEITAPAGFRQILTLKTVITRRFTLEAGESVSYNRTYTASEDESAAAVPIGYADGIERHLSNTGWLMHADGRCPIIGRVCMDQSVISAPASAHEGDPVTVISDGSDGAMTVAVVGEICGTNTYEPVTRIAARVPRLYLRNGAPVSWSVPILGESGTFRST
ncbi:MAG: alanine racemase [Thermomicrobiales bacterium]